jgi:hypothetical protein
MTHIYLKPIASVEKLMKRRASITEINILRKFEGSSLIEDRIARQLGKLHKLWFPPLQK